jgi:FkbM family methyltransferase
MLCMKYLRRNRGIGSYLAKKITRRHLRSISKEYIETKDQLAMFSFDFISQMISVDGRYEDGELKLIEKIFKGRLDKRAILDVGANIGNHTVAFSKIAKKVYAFEPNIFVFELLRMNTKKLKNVEIFNFGASDQNQSTLAKIPKLNWGGGSLDLDEKNSQPNKFIEVLFKLKTLDSIQILQKINIGMIKIDVEGHELNAFKGMKSLLRKNKPIILFEQNRGILNQTSEEIKFLQSIGYKYLYEFKKTDDWITPSNMPKTFQSLLKFFEVLILGEPLSEFELSLITRLEKKTYDILFFACNPIE